MKKTRRSKWAPRRSGSDSSFILHPSSLIVVDVGNSRIKWGRCLRGAVAESVSLPADDSSAWERQLERWREVDISALPAGDGEGRLETCPTAIRRAAEDNLPSLAHASGQCDTGPKRERGMVSLAARLTWAVAGVHPPAARTGVGGIFNLRAAAAGQWSGSALAVEPGPVLARQFEADQKHGHGALRSILAGAPVAGAGGGALFSGAHAGLPGAAARRGHERQIARETVSNSGFTVACAWCCCWLVCGWRLTRSPGRGRLCNTSSAFRCRC